MGCHLSSNSNNGSVVTSATQQLQQAIRRKSSHLILTLDPNNSASRLPREFIAAEACQLLHDSIEKRNEEAVVRLLYSYKDDEYETLLQHFMEEYCIDPVTLAFQNLSSSTSEIVRLRLTSPIKNISHFLNFHLRDKTSNFQIRILGVILGYQEIDLKLITTDYYNRYGFTLSNHLYTGFEGEILDFLKDLLNKNTEEQILEESLQQELEMSQNNDQLSSPTAKHGGHKGSIHSGTAVNGSGGRFSNGSLTGLTKAAIVMAKNTREKESEGAVEETGFQFYSDEVYEWSVSECVDRLHKASINNQLIEGEQVVFKILASLSRQKLRDIFESYVQKYQRDIVVDIEQSAPQSYLRDLLVLSIQILRNDALFFANEINTLLKSNDEDSAKNYYLMFYLMTRSKDAIYQIKKIYRNHYFESLHDDIRSMITDPLLQSALLKALARVSSSNT